MRDSRTAVSPWLVTCFALLTCLLVLGTNACNDSPTDLGSEFVIDTADTYRLLSSDYPLFVDFENGRIDTFISGRPLFNAGPLYVGRLEDGSEALSILRFSTISNVDDRDLFDQSRYTIQSLTLNVFASNYAIGDTAANLLEFGVHDLEWRDEKTFGAFTTRSVIEERRANGQALFAANPSAEFRGSLPFADTAVPVQLGQIDHELFFEWMRRRNDFVIRREEALKNGDTINDENYGLALLPTEGNNLIRSFATPQISTLEDVPFSYLEMVYQHVDSTGLDTVRIEAGNDASYVDTPPAPEKRFVLQGASAWRLAVDLDISEIPALSRVAYVQLELTLDKSLTLEGRGGNRESNDITVRSSEDGSLVVNTTLSRSVAVQADGSGRYIVTQLQSIFEDWLRNDLNQSLLLHTFSPEEQAEMDRLVFYGPDADEVENRPLLKIYYRTRPR